jgi:CHAD domain-containing protein
MSLPEDLLALPAAEAARRIALDKLSAVREAAPRLDDPEDAEALHDFRVAVRRLRSTLRAWKRQLKGRVRKRHRRRLREVQVATGGGRDAEVMLEWLVTVRDRVSEDGQPGLHWLAGTLTARLEGALEHAREDVRAAMSGLDEQLAAELREKRARTKPDRLFGDSVAAALREHLDELTSLLADAESAREELLLHRSRIATKRLRYLVEPLREGAPGAEPVVAACKRLQDVLGDVNDVHVQQDELARRLAELPEGPLTAGLKELQELAAERLSGLERRLLGDWLDDGLKSLEAPMERLLADLGELG